MKTEVVTVDDYHSPKAMVHHSETPNSIGTFAMALIERWGLVAATPDGEDSAGRAKLALLPVSEVVARACDTAEATFATLRERGHMVDIPSWEELREKQREERGKN